MNYHYYLKHSAKVKKFLDGKQDSLSLYTNNATAKRLEKEFLVKLHRKGTTDPKTGLAMYKVVRI